MAGHEAASETNNTMRVQITKGGEKRRGRPGTMGEERLAAPGRRRHPGRQEEEEAAEEEGDVLAAGRGLC